jgi:hypothetical protein
VVSFRITKGNVHDTKKFCSLVRESYSKYNIDKVYADKAHQLPMRLSIHSCTIPNGARFSTFGPNPDVELFKFKPHKRSWILQAIKRFGDYYFRKYNNREVTQLIRQIIERYDLNKDLDMKDHIYLVSPQFIEEKVKKIITLPGEIGFIARLGLLSGLREQELIYIKEKQVCNNGYGCDCEKLHTVDCKRNEMTIIAIGWTRGNKKALATILPTKYWEKLHNMPKFDYTDIAATHKIMKRDVGIAYIAMRKIHYNVMRFRDTVYLDEEVLAGRFKSVSAGYYVLHA